MKNVPDSVQAVCATIDELYVHHMFASSPRDEVMARLLGLFTAVCRDKSISLAWRQFLCGYASGSFPFFAHDVCGIDNGIGEED